MGYAIALPSGAGCTGYGARQWLARWLARRGRDGTRPSRSRLEPGLWILHL